MITIKKNNNISTLKITYSNNWTMNMIIDMK